MFLKAQPIFFKTETPLHMGSGTDLGIIDMPIQRERHTSFPKIEASGLKGSMRDIFTEKIENKNIIDILFGPEDQGKESYASSLGFSDGRLLFFPVKSMKGVFAWITCQEVLYRFINDMKMCYDDKNSKFFDELVIPKSRTIISKNSDLLVNNNKIILEEFTFQVKPMNDNEIKTLEKIIDIINHKENKDDYFYQKMKKDIVVLKNDDFKDFVNYSTEVITRTKIGENGTAASQALFTEEYLPVNSILYSLVFSSPIFSNKVEEIFKANSEKEQAEKIINYFIKNIPSIIQLGGNATLGKGLVKISTGGLNNGK